MSAPQSGARPANLLLLMSGTEGYGVRRVLEVMVRGFSQRGRPVSIALIDRKAEDIWRKTAPGLPVASAPFGPLPPIKGTGVTKFASLLRRGSKQFGLASWLRGVIKEQEIGSIIVRSPPEVTLAAFAAAGTKARVFWLMPNSVSADYPLDINRRVYRFLFRSLHVMPLANSHHTNGTLGPGDYPRRVVHLGIDVTQFRPGLQSTIERASLGIPEGAPIIGVFARMLQEKGQALLVEALASADPSIHVILGGGPMDTPYSRTLVARTEALGLKERVHFIGPQSDVIPYYALCDVTLNTRLDPEPFGMSVIESMAMAKPVLAHRAGGPGETILDGKTGWLMDEPTEAAFVAGLARMMDDRPRWPEMGAAARSHVEEHFTADKLIDRLEAALSGEPAPAS